MVDIQELAPRATNSPALKVPDFTVTSNCVNRPTMATAQYSGLMGVPGPRLLPLAWAGAPEGTKSYAVTILTPMPQPVPASQHWSVGNHPADMTKID